MSNEELAAIMLAAAVDIAQLVQAVTLVVFDARNAEKSVKVANEATSELLALVNTYAPDLCAKATTLGEME